MSKLVNCPDCSKQVSVDALSCPNCGMWYQKDGKINPDWNKVVKLEPTIGDYILGWIMIILLLAALAQCT